MRKQRDNRGMKACTSRPWLRKFCAGVLAAVFFVGLHGSVLADWKSLVEDEIHDPTGPSLHELQEPREVLSKLPNKDIIDGLGNQVRWVHALQSGAIKPRRSRVLPEPDIPVVDMDVLLDLRGSMRVVRFPHKAHTEWLTCENCHDEIFVPKIGANKLSMYSILNGEQCGRCHGAVAFPITDQCILCHSVKHPDEKETN
jgi:c(7)-type cytochrome triheme protein